MRIATKNKTKKNPEILSWIHYWWLSKTILCPNLVLIPLIIIC